MAKVKVPERIVHLTQQLRERCSCKQLLDDMLEDYEVQESSYFEEDNEEVVFLRILNDLFAIHYYSELSRGYQYGIPDEKAAKKIKWYEQRRYRASIGETYCSNKAIVEKLNEVMALKRLINAESEERKFNRLISISENELEKIEGITDISGANHYVKIFLKVEKHSEEEIQLSIQNAIKLAELRFVKEALEFLHPKEVATYFVIF